MSTMPSLNKPHFSEEPLHQPDEFVIAAQEHFEVEHRLAEPKPPAKKYDNDTTYNYATPDIPDLEESDLGSYTPLSIDQKIKNLEENDFDVDKMGERRESERKRNNFGREYRIVTEFSLDTDEITA